MQDFNEIIFFGKDNKLYSYNITTKITTCLTINKLDADTPAEE